MKNIFFTADTHFGHNAIRRFCDRPFDTVKKMDEALIQNWNALIRPRDTVYHLGDFSYKAADDLHCYLKRLNGKIHLVLGNHDNHNLRVDCGSLKSVNDLLTVNIDGQRITLCHYAMRVWPASHRGSWHLYGHSHGKLPDDPNSLSIDVGVDCHDYFPIPFDRVKELMAEKTWIPPFGNEGVDDSGD